MKETQQRNLLLYIVTQLPFQCGDPSCVREMEFPHLFTAFVALWLPSQSCRPNRGISPHARHAQRQNWLELGMTLHAHNSLGPLNSLRRSGIKLSTWIMITIAVSGPTGGISAHCGQRTCPIWLTVPGHSFPFILFQNFLSSSTMLSPLKLRPRKLTLVKFQDSQVLVSLHTGTVVTISSSSQTLYPPPRQK